MLLRDYLHKKRFEKEKMTLKKFAALLEVTSTHLTGYIHGRTRISKPVAKLIEEITKGEVTAKEILDNNPPKKSIQKMDD